MLPEIPGLRFFPDPLHRYYLDGFGYLDRSVTEVVGHNMTAKTRDYIESSKHIWLPRGLAGHHALEQHLLGQPVTPDETYQPWIDALLDQDIWKGSETLAVEYRLCDERKSLAGSFDFLIRRPDGQVILGDLKTVETVLAANSRKPATEQLGAYAAMLIDSHPHLTIDWCCTVVAGPGVTRVIPQKPTECISAWLDCWDAYKLLQPVWDF